MGKSVGRPEQLIGALQEKQIRPENPAREHANQKRKEQIQLTMLTWFLRSNLPEYVPELFQRRPTVVAHSEQGVSNFTFFTWTDQGQQLVVRMKQKPDDVCARGALWADYHKEAWISQTIGHIVPVPGLVKEGIGYIDGSERKQQYAYIIQDFLPYTSASTIEDSTSRKLLFERLGEVGQKINSTPARGFGRNLKDSHDEFEFDSWSLFMEAELEACALPALLDAGTISDKCVRNTEKIVSRLSSLKIEPTLFHTDFTNNWGNVLVDKDLQIRAIIDWEFASSGFALPWELAITRYVYLRDGISEEEYLEEFESILRGYGLTLRQFEDEHGWSADALMLLHALQKVKRYEKMRADGLLTAPWRKKFAARAENLVESLSGRLA